MSGIDDSQPERSGDTPAPSVDPTDSALLLIAGRIAVPPAGPAPATTTPRSAALVPELPETPTPAPATPAPAKPQAPDAPPAAAAALPDTAPPPAEPEPATTPPPAEPEPPLAPPEAAAPEPAPPPVDQLPDEATPPEPAAEAPAAPQPAAPSEPPAPDQPEPPPPAQPEPAAPLATTPASIRITHRSELDDFVRPSARRTDHPPIPEIGDAQRSDPMSALVAPPQRVGRSVLIIAVLSIVVGLGALLASAWVYSESQRDLRQVASDIAQLRVSLELFARQQTEAPDVGEVYARLMEVEQSVRDAIAAIPQPQAVPAVPAPPVGLGPSARSDGDCLPPGTRFLVTAGDRYPVCGTEGVIEVLSVGALDIALADGTAIAIGGSTTLANTSCTVAVLSANADGLSGYGEIRVNC